MLRGGCTRNASCITIQVSVNVEVGTPMPTRRVISISACSKSLTGSFEQGCHLLWGQTDQELGTFSVVAAFQLCLNLLLPYLPDSAASHTQDLQ